MEEHDVRGAMNPTNVPYRVENLERQVDEQGATIALNSSLTAKHELELHGERGVNATLRDLSNEIKWLRRALWGLAASVTVASVVFALGTLGGTS